MAVTKTYAEIVMPGFYQNDTVEVDERSVLGIAIPPQAEGIYFYDVSEMVDNEGETLCGEPKNFSGITYFGDRILTIDDARQILDNAGKHISSVNLGMADCSHVVQTRWGSYKPLKPGDTVLTGFCDKIWGEKAQTPDPNARNDLSPA